MSDKAEFKRSCDEAEEFPRNLVYHNTFEHNLHRYSERLYEHEVRLFFDEKKASLDIWDFDDESQGFQNTNIKSYFELNDHLVGASLFAHQDPACRFIFVNAPHSRERLRVTRNMLVFALTYHQVMPAFLDFLFPFGKQQYMQGFHFSGFRHEDRLSTGRRGLDIQELGRTGRDIRVCYGLKSVEPSRARDDWPWSIRQTATYHSLDVETGKSLWIIIKADQLIKRRMEAATKPRGTYRIDSFGSSINALTSSLSAHLILFDWCGENWRWYINFLEQGLENTTRRTRLIRFDTPTSVLTKNSITLQGNQDVASSSLTTEKTGLSLSSQHATHQSRRAPQKQSPPTILPEPTATSVLAAEQSDGEADFSFSDLQHVQFLEEKVNEILLVLEANINVISELKEHYQEVVASEDFPYVLRQECAGDIKRFWQGITSTVSDLRMQYSRTKTLLQTLTDRKSLLYGILEYRNVQANKMFAERSQLSTENMEALTEDMHKIAHKTKQETVSMRIITLVTLFFLPGTFISTIMSTDIIHFNTTDTGESQRVYQKNALQLYLAISLPLMFLTFTAWYGVYWWVNRKDDKKARLNSVV